MVHDQGCKVVLMTTILNYSNILLIENTNVTTDIFHRDYLEGFSAEQVESVTERALDYAKQVINNSSSN